MRFKNVSCLFPGLAEAVWWTKINETSVAIADYVNVSRLGCEKKVSLSFSAQ